MKSVSVILAGLFACGSAQAGVIQVGGAPAGSDGMKSNRAACTVDFNSGNASNACGAIYSADAAGTTPLNIGHFVTGSLSNQYATPAGDTTPYLTVGTTAGSPAYITLATAANYFGFYAGSLDTFNLVEFFLGSTLVDSFTGSDINAVAFPGTAATGNQAQAQYIDYFPGTVVGGVFVRALYDRIRYSSAGNSFETDNHAFGVVPLVVPEPAPLALLAIGSLGAIALRRRRR